MTASTDNPYEQFGVRRVINAMGAVTYLGGLPISAEVRDTMHVASALKVDLFEFSQIAGARVAELLGVQAAMLTTGAAAGWQLSAAACLAGDNRSAIAELPATEGSRNQIAIHRKHRGNFDHALRSAGAHLTDFGYSRDRTEAWELSAALTDETVAVAYVTDFGDDSVLPLVDVVGLAHEVGVPVIVDAALSLPPVENLKVIPETGADLVSFSGGKALGGPQNTGFVVGSAELIQRCRANTSPNHNTIGRAMKLPAEHMAGLVRALELYLARDHDLDRRRWRDSLEVVRAALEKVAPAAAIEEFPRYAPPIPKLLIPVDDPAALAEELAAGDPSIRVGLRPHAVTVCPHAIAVEDFDLLADRLVAALSRSQP